MAMAKTTQDEIFESENYKIYAGFLTNYMQKLFSLNLSSDINVLKIIMNNIEYMVDSFAAIEKLQEKNDKKEEAIEPTLVNVKVEKEGLEEIINREIKDFKRIFEAQKTVPRVAEQNIIPGVAQKNVIPRYVKQNLISRHSTVDKSPMKASTEDNYQKLAAQGTDQNIPRPKNGKYRQYQTKSKVEAKYDHRKKPYEKSYQYNLRELQQPYHQLPYPQHRPYENQQPLQQPDMYNIQQYQIQTLTSMIQQAS